MFPWKKEAKAPEKRSGGGQRSRHLGQMGLLDVPDLDAMCNLDGDMDDDDCNDDEDELEAELRALEAGYDIRKVVSRKRLEESFEPKKVKSERSQELGKSNRMDDEEVDENDPELLAELEGIEGNKLPFPAASLPQIPGNVRPVPTARPRAPPAKVISSTPQQLPSPMSASLAPLNRSAPLPRDEVKSTIDVLQDRVQNYRSAQENARIAGESAKIRRLDRGLKALETMLKSARAGKPVVEEDIPPPVAIGTKPTGEPQQTDTTLPESYHKVPANASSASVPLTFSKPVLPSLGNEITSNTGPPPPLPPRLKPAPLPPITPVSAVEDPERPKVEMIQSPNQALNMLTARRTQYRQAALAAKKENDEAKMREYVKIAKKFDLVISAVEQGQEVDLQGMPPPLPEFDGRALSQSARQLPSKLSSAPQLAPLPVRPPNVSGSQPMLRTTSISRDQPLELPTVDEPDDPSVFNAPPPPSSTLEALQQRLQRYKMSLDEAKTSDNGSKARRMGRIVKQYEDALRAYKAGRPVAFDELPTPPGFAPIPRDTGPPKASPQPPSSASQGSHLVMPSVAIPAESGASSGRQPGAPSKSPSSLSGNLPKSSVPPQISRQAPAPPSKPTQKSPQSLYEKQLAAILERQQLFKGAALDAKKRGDLQAAKEYLRLAKGFEPMINASKCGLPVNMDSLPLPPQLNRENNFEIVNHEDCQPTGDRDEMYEKLDKDLISQIEMCAKNRVYFSKLGDVQNAHKFETMLLDTKKDLDFVRYSKKRADPVPRFHYETRTFSIVKCCTDLGDDDLELSIMKGINYACPNPSEVDTYVRFEFPFPPEATQKDKTATVRDTNNPEYNAVFKLNISRKSRNCTSVFKRKGVKLEVWAKGGFLRSDVLLGTATVKLQPLETRCVLHDSFDLVEGRKPVGGKLEVKIRVRDPLITKQVETHCEKWLVVNDNKATRV